MRPGGRGDLLHRVLHARRRLGVHDRHEIGAAVLERAPHRAGIDRAAPLPVHAPHLAAVARGHLREPLAEVAVHDRHHARARRDEVGDRRLHPGRAGARHRERERALGRAKDAPERRAHVVHQIEQRGIEVPEHGRRHRAHHARRARGSDRARAAGVRSQAVWSCGCQQRFVLLADEGDDVGRRRRAAARAAGRRRSRRSRPPPSARPRRSASPTMSQNGSRRRCSASASSCRPASASSKSSAQRSGMTPATASTPAARADAHGRVERRVRAAEHGEARRGACAMYLPEQLEVGPGLLDADDVRVRRQPRERVDRQGHAGEDRHVVQQHRHRGRVRHRLVVPHEVIGRHLRAEERRRPHDHGIGAGGGGPPRGGDGAARRLAARARDEQLRRAGPRAARPRASDRSRRRRAAALRCWSRGRRPPPAGCGRSGRGCAAKAGRSTSSPRNGVTTGAYTPRR